MNIANLILKLIVLGMSSVVLAFNEKETEKLIEAAMQGDLKEVKRCLTSKGDPTAKYSYAVKMACRNGHFEVVKALLSWKGPSREWVDPRVDYNVAIQKASQKGHIETVRELLSWKGPNREWVDPRDDNHFAIVLASENGHIEVVKALLNWKGPKGEWVDPTANDNNLSIQKACYKGHFEVVKALLSWKGPNGEWADPRANDNEAIRYTSKNGHIKVVNALLNWKGPNDEVVDPTDQNNYAIRWAIKFGHIEVVKALLSWKGPKGEWVDPTANDNEAIKWARENDRVEVVKALFDWKGPNGELIFSYSDIKEVILNGAVRKAFANNSVEIVLTFMEFIGLCLIERDSQLNSSKDQVLALNQTVLELHNLIKQTEATTLKNKQRLLNLQSMKQLSDFDLPKSEIEVVIENVSPKATIPFLLIFICIHFCCILINLF